MCLSDRRWFQGGWWVVDVRVCYLGEEFVQTWPEIAPSCGTFGKICGLLAG